MNRANEIKIVSSFRFDENDISPLTYARLAAFVRAARSNPGCEQIEILEDINEPEYFTLISVWKSSEAAELHLKTTYYKDFAAFLVSKAVVIQVRILKSLEV